MIVDEEVLARVMAAVADRKVRRLKHELLAAEVEHKILKAIEREKETYVGFDKITAYDTYGNNVGDICWAEIDLSSDGGLRVYGDDTVSCKSLTLLSDNILRLLSEKF